MGEVQSDFMFGMFANDILEVSSFFSFSKNIKYI